MSSGNRLLKDTLLTRVGRFMKVARSGATAARELVEMRCDRGASIARTLLMPEETATAIQNLDEHWDGLWPRPGGLLAEDIPISARIICLGRKTVEVFYRRDGLDGAMDMAHGRSGSWFDPDLVRAFKSICKDAAFWEKLNARELLPQALRFEPEDRVIPATDEHLDCIAAGFSQVIDAKSPWTFRHSEGVAALSAGIAEVLGYDPSNVQKIRRAALVHDIGKLGISNLVLDKPASSNPPKSKSMCIHPYYTCRQIFEAALNGFKGTGRHCRAHTASRLDGKGYDRGMDASQISLDVRILTISDMFEASPPAVPIAKTPQKMKS